MTTGLGTPDSLVTAESTLADAKAFQTKLENLIKVLDTAAEIAKKMSHHDHADITVSSFRQRWHNTHSISKWVYLKSSLLYTSFNRMWMWSQWVALSEFSRKKILPDYLMTPKMYFHNFLWENRTPQKSHRNWFIGYPLDKRFWGQRVVIIQIHIIDSDHL